MMHSQFQVWAEHVAEEFRADGDIAQIYFDEFDKTYSAAMPQYGHGKSFATPRMALISLLEENGCCAYTLKEKGAD